jgi:type IV pilus assembly protein PilX
MRCPPHSKRPTQERGVVLPIALIMLVIISFAGLLAARNSASFEQFSNNMRTNQVARVFAEDALRQCERVARASVEGSAAFADVGKVEDTNVIAADTEMAISGGLWNTRSNWASGAANLITVIPSYTGSDAQSSAQIKVANRPTCIVQAMINDRFLITSRGLSNDAVVDAGGQLTSGSEVWLQSILTPIVPTLSAGGAPN